MFDEMCKINELPSQTPIYFSGSAEGIKFFEKAIQEHLKEHNLSQKTMKQHYNYHSFEMRTNKFTLGSLEIHNSEVREDETRMGVKESFIFNGFTICFAIFEATFGVKIYETI